MSFAEKFLSAISPFGFVHIVGWAIVAGAIWGAVGFCWVDGRDRWGDSNNEGKILLGGGGTLFAGMWPLLVIALCYGAVPIVVGFVVWKGARNFRKTRSARPAKEATPKSPPPDSYEKQGEREVEEVLKEDPWMSAFLRKPKKTPATYS